MVNFHPTDNTLLEFSAGNLDWAIAICVSAHLQFCPTCRNKILQFDALGGNSLDKSEPQAVSASSFQSVMSRIKKKPCEHASDAPQEPEKPVDPRAQALPAVVQKLIPKERPLPWKSLSKGLNTALLETGQNKYEVSLYKIKRGCKAFKHDHSGLEVTLVLEGSFSDEKGNYLPGDFIEKQPGDVHSPMASQDQDCLCLSILEAPVKMTGVLGKFVNPFLSISPR